jgi:nucleoside-diphosphate-sugar epimerase
MFNIFVLGATGFIGLPVCLALRRAGHIVYGLTRSEAKAKQLAKDEILPVVGNATDTKTWIELALSVDVVIDCADGPVQQGIFDAIKTSHELRPKGSAKLVYIYCSGTWFVF